MLDYESAPESIIIKDSDIYILNKHNLKTKNRKLGSKIFCAMFLNYF